MINAGKSGDQDSTRSSVSVVFSFLTLSAHPVDSGFLFLTSWDTLKFSFFLFKFN